MKPHRRPEGAPAPQYGAHSSYFSLEINHGGFFVGNGSNKSYVDGSVIWYDHVDTVTWSTLMIENILEEVGYEMSGRIKVYYCIPILSLERNGLREIRDDQDTQFIATFVSFGHHIISLFLDHGDALRSTDLDDVVLNPIAQLPPVLSPGKPSGSKEREMTAKQSEMGGEQSEIAGSQEEACADRNGPVPIQVMYSQMEATEVENDVCIAARTRLNKRNKMNETPVLLSDEEDEDSADSDFDPKEIVDSDFDISDDDDDLYADNVDVDEDKPTNSKHVSATVPTDKGKQKVCKEENSDEEDLWAPNSDDEGDQYKFKSFRNEDMQDPHFHVGQLFESVDFLRQAIRAYSCINRNDIKLPVNDKKRVKAKCEDDCSWYLWASVDSRTKCFMVKRYVPERTCSKKWKVYSFTAHFLAERYLESFRADQDMNLKNFSRVVQKDWNMTPGRSKLQRARRIAMRIIYGDEEGQYTMLWDYANEIRRSNPGSSFYMSLDANARFKLCYMSLEASKRGFLTGCRPVIFIDGCHIKTRYRGQLLTAVGMDPNDCIFPIAIAAVEVEDTATWTWFLETLKNDLGIVNTTPWTIMSDKQKGLINAVRDVFPDSEHRFCVRHMWQNFQQLFRGDALKNQLWKIARSSTVALYEKHMEAMKVLNPDAYAWLDNLDVQTWVRAFQSDIPKCDVLLNNNCEVFNKYILEARELPVLSMLQRVKGQMMARHYTKQMEAEKWHGPVCPKIRKKVEKHIELSNNCFADGAGDGVFAVGEMFSSTPVDYVVDLKSKTCTCNRWQKTGIPCPHAVSCLRSERIDPLTVVDKCYSVEMHKRAYGNIIFPCKDKTEWENMHGPLILPPLYKKHVGRPTKKRRRAPGEVDAREGGKKMSRHGVIMHCSYCGFPDHNIAGCNYFKQGLPPPNATEAHVPPPQPEVQVPPPQPEVQVPPLQPEDQLVNTMVQQRTVPRIVEASPIPESSFITAAQNLMNQERHVQASSSTIRQGDLAQRLLAMQQEKNKANEDRKIAILETKYEAQLKKAEEMAKKRLEQEKRKAEEAQEKARLAAEKREKRRYDAELTKQARAETRKFVAETKRELAEKKRKELAAKRDAEKKLAAEQRAANKAAKRGGQSSQSSAYVQGQFSSRADEFVPAMPTRVNMFDEFR